jgi:CspA family cold shock protein
MRYQGTVLWFKNKFGFLGWKKENIQQPDLFVHYSDLEMPGFRELQKGDKISFALGENHSKKLKAIEVRKEEK